MGQPFFSHGGQPPMDAERQSNLLFSGTSMIPQMNHEHRLFMRQHQQFLEIW
jgi:hypothetical protein